MQEELCIGKVQFARAVFQENNELYRYFNSPVIFYRAFTRSLLLKTVEPSFPASWISPRTRVYFTHSKVLSTDVNSIPPPWSEWSPTKTDNVLVQIFCDRHQEKYCRTCRLSPLTRVSLALTSSPRRGPRTTWLDLSSGTRSLFSCPYDLFRFLSFLDFFFRL